MLMDVEASKIVVPNNVKSTRSATRSQIINIGRPRTHLAAIEASPEDWVLFNEKHAQHYEINDKKFIILPQEKILGKVSAEK